MGAKRFLDLHDFVRHGVDVHIECANGHCTHSGVAEAYALWTWFRIHRWPHALDVGTTYLRFRCTRCGSRAGKLRPTMNPVTVTNFFPADEQGWKRAIRRLRG